MCKFGFPSPELHLNVLLFISHMKEIYFIFFSRIRGGKVFRWHKGSTSCNGSKFGFFICQRPAVPQHNKPITKVILLLDNVLNCYIVIVNVLIQDDYRHKAKFSFKIWIKIFCKNWRRSGWSSWPDQQTKMIELDPNPAQFWSSIATSYDG